MKKIVVGISLFIAFFIALPVSSYAVETMNYYDVSSKGITPIPCGTSEARSCPKEMLPIYEKLGEPCARSYEEFTKNPTTRHFWIEDPAITAQGKANERARQFIYWSINNRAIDDHPVLREIWGTTSSIAFFFVVLVAAIFGLGFIVSRRTNFQLNLALWPTLVKIGGMLIYIALSAAVILLLIQVSEILMRFFIDNLGGKDLFNIYFSNSGSLGSSERNYTDFVGCRDLNLRVDEPIEAKLFLYKLTNITYYIMGTMIILRKILLWFLLFVAPFLALLMPFVFIRNIGWIWIGVFFQWLMYGPLFALFLGALSKIWKAGIPFTFDFSRVVSTDKFAASANPLIGYTYPTAMNILYGGPAQINDRQLSAINSGSYVDTFVEYVITLIMLWAVTFFPWWLLRIFRDYCCDGIYAMKNLLMAMYDTMRTPPGKDPGPVPKFPDMKATLKIPEKTVIDQKISTRLSSMEQIKKSATSDISKSLDLHVTKLTDIARLESDKTRMSALRKNMDYLSNPAKAQTSTERQQFMNLRTELFNRAIKQDAAARTLLSTTSTSTYERTKVREELVRGLSHLQSATTATPTTVSLSKDSIANISRIADISTDQAQNIVQAYQKSNTASMNKMVAQLSKQFNVSSEKVKTAIQTSIAQQTQKTTSIVTSYMSKIAENTKVIAKLSAKTGLNKEQVKSIVSAYMQHMDKPANEVINNITNVTNISQDKVKGTLQQMSGMMYTRQLILDFSEDNKVEAEQVVQAIAHTATATGETPDMGGPQGGPPEQPTKTEAELQQEATTTQKAKEAEAGSVDAMASGVPQPTSEEKKLAEAFAKEALADDTFAVTFGVKEAEQAAEQKSVIHTVIHVVNENVESANEVIKEVAAQEQIKEEEAAQVVQEQLQIAAEPEKNVEKIVAVPPSVSIEEYEELKQMWSEQYENGDIPVQDNIQSREEWVDQDIVTITNVMNKIISPNPELQQQGLDELGFIIPIFMINNMKGDQLITYLKAKLEAAKSVQKLLNKEREIREKLEKQKEDDEELVELKNKKAEATQEPMHMEMDEDKGPTSIEDRAQVEVQAAPEVNKAYSDDTKENGAI